MAPFIKAVFVGTLAGAAAPLLLTIPIALISLGDGGVDGTLTSSLMIAVAPLLVTLPFVLVCSLLVGLPATFLLRHYRKETASAYLLTGCIAGPVAPLLVLWAIKAQSGWWMAMVGTFSGGMTASSWARGRGMIDRT